MDLPPAAPNANRHTDHSETHHASAPLVAPPLPPHVMKQRLAEIIQYERSTFSVNAPSDIVAFYNRIDKDPRPFEPVEVDEDILADCNDGEVSIPHDDTEDTVYANNDATRGSPYAQKGTLDAGVFPDSESHMVQPQPFETDTISLHNGNELLSKKADVGHHAAFNYHFNTMQGPAQPDPRFIRATPKPLPTPLDDPAHEDLRKAPSFEQHLVENTNVMAKSSNVPNIELNPPPPPSGPSVTTPSSTSGDPESTRDGKRQTCILKNRWKVSYLDNEFLAFTTRTLSPQWLPKADTIQICHWRGCGQSFLTWEGFEHHKEAGHYHRQWRKEGCLWMMNGVRCGEGFVESLQQHLNLVHYRRNGGWCTCCGQFFRGVGDYDAHLRVLP